jgi:hypothetical protein
LGRRTFHTCSSPETEESKLTPEMLKLPTRRSGETAPTALPDAVTASVEVIAPATARATADLHIRNFMTGSSQV